MVEVEKDAMSTPDPAAQMLMRMMMAAWTKLSFMEDPALAKL